MRIRRLRVRDLRRYRELDIDLAPGVTVIRGPNEAGQVDDPARHRAGPHPARRPARPATSKRSGRGTRRAGGPPVDRHRVRAGRGRRPIETGTLEKIVRRREGHGRASSTTARRHHRPDARRPGHGRADRHPDRGVLPLDRVGPPSRAERPGPRRGGAARPAPGLDQRRRPGHRAGPSKKLDRALHDLTTKGDKNPGRLKVAEEAVAQSTAARRAGRAAPWPSSNATATRWPARANDAPRPTPALAERRSMLEKARQAERFEAERDAAKERYERLPRGGRGRRPSSTAWPTTHPSPNPLPVIRAERRAPARRWTAGSASCGRQLAGEVDVQFEVAPEPTWRPLSRWAILLVAARARHRRWARSRPAPWTSSTSATIPTVPRWRRRGGRPDPRRSSRSGSGATPRCRSSCATSRSTAGCAAARRWRRSCARPRRTPNPSSARSGWTTSRRPRTCCAGKRPTSPGSTS